MGVIKFNISWVQLPDYYQNIYVSHQTPFATTGSDCFMLHAPSNSLDSIAFHFFFSILQSHHVSRILHVNNNLDFLFQGLHSKTKCLQSPSWLSKFTSYILHQNHKNIQSTN